MTKTEKVPRVPRYLCPLTQQQIDAIITYCNSTHESITFAFDWYDKAIDWFNKNRSTR